MYCRAQFDMRSPKNTLQSSGDLTVKEPDDNVDSRLSQTVAKGCGKDDVWPHNCGTLL